MSAILRSYMMDVPPELMTDEKRQLLVSGYMKQVNKELSIYQLNIPKEINGVILLYTKEGIYIITWHTLPMGFSGIMDNSGRNCIVSSVQDPTNIAKGMKRASRIFSINDQIVLDWKHKDILKQMARTPCPRTVVFIEVNHDCYILYICVNGTFNTQAPKKTFKSKDLSKSLVLSDYKHVFSCPKDAYDRLPSFAMAADLGYVFLQHSRRKRKPHKVLLRTQFKDYPKSKKVRCLSWGSGSRHIDIDDIQQILWGKYTPNFQSEYCQELDDYLCFTVVGKNKSINLSSLNEHLTQFWVQGLSALTSIEYNQPTYIQHMYALYGDDSASSYSSWDDETHVTSHFVKKNKRKAKKGKKKYLLQSSSTTPVSD